MVDRHAHDPVDPATRLIIIRAIIQEWLDKQGHERCWYYPELFQQLARELGLEPGVPPALPAEEEFEEGCARYRADQYRQP